MFFLESGDKEQCYGCRACELICPTKCISFRGDEEGFLYPFKDEESCVGCDLCRVVCPNLNKGTLLKDGSVFQTKAYMAIHEDEDVLYKSASGGAFSGIVSSFCDDDFVVFGVELNEHLKVTHSYTQTILGTDKYRKSKYIQSDVNDSYEKARGFLKEGKKVLFTGTPCQVAGLRLYLGRDYDHLLTVDLVCHGVPSQKVFDCYVDYLQQEHEGLLVSYEFRHKTFESQEWSSRNIRAVIDNAEIVVSSTNDPYLRGFHKALFYRPSCYKCKYANQERVSDVTLADFWGVEKKYPGEQVHRGVSVVLTNTVKGQLLIDRMEEHMLIQEVDRSFVVENNAQLRMPVARNPKRTEFFENLDNVNFAILVDRYAPRPSFARRMASKYLSYETKVFIKNLWNRR